MSGEGPSQWVEENELRIEGESPVLGAECSRVWSPTAAQCPTDIHPGVKLAAESTGRFLSNLVIWAAAGVVAVAGHLEKKVTAYIDEATTEQLPPVRGPVYRKEVATPIVEDPLWRRALRRKTKDMIEAGFNWLKPRTSVDAERVHSISREEIILRPETDNDFADFEEEDRLCSLRPPTPRDLLSDQAHQRSDEALGVRNNMPPAWLERADYPQPHF